MGFEAEVYPASREAHGRSAGYVRNRILAWAGTHLIAFWDGLDRVTKHMIETAESNGLPVRTTIGGRRKDDKPVPAQEALERLLDLQTAEKNK